MVIEPAWAGVVVSFLVGLSGLVLGIFNFMVARRVAKGQVLWKISQDVHRRTGLEPLGTDVWRLTNVGSRTAENVTLTVDGAEAFALLGDGREFTPNSSHQFRVKAETTETDPPVVTVSWKEGRKEKSWRHPLVDVPNLGDPGGRIRSY